ncbi:hypothetical protein BDR04DRAFT_281515 [Suillus decipiens]|nr:hypothetical protein BDR04DRAFT_281515 [Suillus decipiens]
MGVESSRPPVTAPVGSSEKPATKAANTVHAVPCTAVSAMSVASSGETTQGQIKATSGADVTMSRNKEDKATAIAPTPNNAKLNASSVIVAMAATSGETLGLDCASVTRQETKCNRDFCIPELHEPPRTSENEAVVATGSGLPGNVNEPPLIERTLSVIPKEEFAPVEHLADNSLDSISSAIIPESFETSEPLSPGHVQQPFTSNITRCTASIERSLSPRKNSIIVNVPSYQFF